LAEAAADAVRRKLRLFGFFGTAEGNLPLQTADGDFEPAGGLPASGEIDPLRQKYGSTIHYSEADITENPTLADMARAALDVLSSRGNFWLMVEAGDVDWASHANNIDTSIGAVRSGDAAFRAVVDWIERRSDWKDTVVIVTSDHGHMFVLTEPEAFASPAD
jgi:alkaline phosphatase